MNRVLAVRGQVAAGDGDAADPPRRAGRRDRDRRPVRDRPRRRRSPGRGSPRPTSAPRRTRSPRSPTPTSSSSGPGSLYTSLLPSLLLPEIRDAVAASPALRVFVCNVATQRGETTGFDLADHVEALVAHAGSGIVDVGPRQQPVRGARAGELRRPGGPAALAALVDPGAAARARGRRRSRERPPPRSRPARRGAAAALRPRERQPAALERRPNGLNPASRA